MSRAQPQPTPDDLLLLSEVDARMLADVLRLYVRDVGELMPNENLETELDLLARIDGAILGRVQGSNDSQ